MGFFESVRNKVFSAAGKEVPKPKETGETPKAEATEVKNAKDTGKERVEKMLATANLRKTDVLRTTGDVLKSVGGAIRDAFFVTIGGVEKGGQVAVDSGKAAATYARDTRTEASDIVKVGIKEGNKLDTEVANFLKTNATKGVDALNSFGDWVMQAEKELKEKAPGVHRDIKSRVEAGARDIGDSLMAAVAEGEEQFNAFHKWVEGAQKEFAQKQGEVHQDIFNKACAKIKPFAEAAGKFAENIVNVPRDITLEFGKLALQAGAARDRFADSANKARLKAAGTAEMKGEIEALRDEVARLGRMVEANSKLSNVTPETTTDKGNEQADADAESLPAGNVEALDEEAETVKTVKA